MTLVELESLVTKFQTGSLRKEDWTHGAHLRVGAWHVHQFGTDEALRRLRAGIRKLNGHHGTPNSETRGYHETITAAYLYVIDVFLRSLPREIPLNDAVNCLIESRISSKDFLHTFYSPATLSSVRARSEWVEPDLTPLAPQVMDFRLLRASARQAHPWKNGFGWTAEIAISPPGASLDTFDWRVSIAGTGRDAPFSIFPGVDRTLALLRGKLSLAIEGRQPIEIHPDSSPLSFAGDAATSATLVEGPLIDLNVMTRRGRFTHSIERIATVGVSEVRLDAGVTLLISCGDGICLEGEVLSEQDGALFERLTRGTVQLVGHGDIFVIRVF